MTIDDTAQATLNAWQAQLAQVRQRRLARGGGHASLAHLHQAQGMTGLQVMTALRSDHRFGSPDYLIIDNVFYQ
jgi:hypothetical protein